MRQDLPTIRFLTAAFILCYVIALFLPVMNVDAAQYAELSREMLHSSDWTQLHIRGLEYLDKPPLHFWLAAMSFKVFGVSFFAYRLPSFLFFILAAYSIRRIGRKLYDVRTGDLASFFFVSSVCGMLMVEDVRTDTILVGVFSFSIWQLLEFQDSGKWKFLIGSFLGIGAAMLVKGPMGIVFPGIILFIHHAYRKEWKKIFRWEWIIGLLIIALMILPMCIGLYNQFDLHPERFVNEHQGVSGLRFYFWTQTFGRLTGESDWGTKFNNGSTPFFFTHTFLWSFAPWFLLTIGGLITKIRSLFRKGETKEMISLGGFVVTFLIISLSKYRLPHYVYITFPFASLLAARFFYEVLDAPVSKLCRIYRGFNLFLVVALGAIEFFILHDFFPVGNVSLILVLMASLILIFWLFRIKEKFARTFYPLACSLLILYAVLLLHFYPALFKYDASAQLGSKLFLEQNKEAPVFICGEVYDNTFDFSAQRLSPALGLAADTADRLKEKGLFYIYCDEENYLKLKSAGLNIEYEWAAENYPVQFLSFPFLNKDTRKSRLKMRHLLRINEVISEEGSPPGSVK